MRRIRAGAIRCKYNAVRYNKKQMKFLFSQKKSIAITHEPHNDV